MLFLSYLIEQKDSSGDEELRIELSILQNEMNSPTSNGNKLIITRKEI